MMQFINGALAFVGSILSWIGKNWAGLIVGAVIAGAGGYFIGHSHGVNDEKDRAIAAQAAADFKAETARKKDDATLRKMSDYDACVIGLRRKRMPVDACEQLRGLDK